MEKEKRFYLGEINHFVSQLELESGKKLDSTRLEQSVEIFNRIRANLRELCRLHSLNCSPLRWSEVFRIIQAAFLLDAKQYLAFLNETIKGIETEKTELRESNASPRIMLIGSPMLPGDKLLIDVIEGCGARIVADTLCTGMRTFEDLIIKEPTIDGIRQTYLDSNPCATAQDIEFNKDRRLNHILRLITEYKVQGVVYYALRFCDHYAFKDDETKGFLADKANIPMIEIHSEYGDAEEGRLRTRIEGFLETLKTPKG
jgi:benzoyl-CoA reductase/2-hydroxyglutaryl-CoA dehydratase subunit BcrC/BadD/HgdB